MHVRLMNWAWWASGGAGQGYPHPELNQLEPVEDDARAMEDALLVLKKRRKQLWRIVELRYLAARDDISASNRLRMSVSTYQGRVRSLYSWLHGYFEREAA